MKKLLYSSVAVIASCGVAAADVSVGGDASVGIKFDDSADNNLSIAHNVDLNLTLSGQTDGGLSFGASATITNSQGVEVEVKSKPSTVSTVTAMDSDTDTDTHTGRYFSQDAVTYLGADGLPVYTDTVNAAGTMLERTYHTKIPGSNFMLAAAGTPVVIGPEGSTQVTVVNVNPMGVDAADPPVIFSYSNAEGNPAAWNTGTLSANGGSIQKWGDRYVIQNAASGASSYLVFAKIDGNWMTVGQLAAALVTADSVDVESITPSAPINPNHLRLLMEIDRAVSAMEAGMAQDQEPETDPHDPVTFTDTTSVADSKAEGSIDEKATVYISGGFGTFTVGDVDAGDTMASGIADIGYDGIGVDDVAEKLRGESYRDFLYEFSAGGVSFGVSSVAGGDSSAMGIKYSLDPVSVGLGYARKGGENVVSVGVGAGLGGVSANIMYSRRSDGDTAAGMDASFSAADNMTVTVAGASNTIEGDKTSAFGIGLTFDLGGGAELGTGVGSIGGDTKADLGLNLVF